MALPIDRLKISFGEAFTFLQEALDKGKQFTEALDALRAGGIGIAESNARAIYDYLSGPLNIGKEYVSNLGLNALPDVSKLAASITPTLRNYSYKVVFNGKNQQGEAAKQYITVSTNTLITPQNAIDVAAGYVGNADVYGLDELDSGDIEDILVNSGGLFE